MMALEHLVVWSLVLAIGIAIFTITGCQLPMR